MLPGYEKLMVIYFQTSFMHKDQTEEMKGWMQMAIMAYHMTGAEKVRETFVVEPI